MSAADDEECVYMTRECARSVLPVTRSRANSVDNLRFGIGIRPDGFSGVKEGLKFDSCL